MLYFGCLDEPGHYLWDQDEHMVRYGSTPWGTDIDSGLCPRTPGQPQGVAALHHRDGWTALSFWDRTVDDRPGSNSAFVERGTLTFEQMCEGARTHFPRVWARLPTLVPCP